MQRSVCIHLHEIKFVETRDNITSLISQNYLPETLISERGLLTSQFEKISEAHSNYLSVAPERICHGFVSKMKHHVERFNSTKSLIDNYILTYKSENIPRRPFRLEKMPLPKFDGIIRYYPQFKKDFEELVLCNIDPKEAAFTLRNCIPSDVRDYLGCCTDDITKMFERLNTEYGDPCKIMESIVSQIHKGKTLDADDPKRIIEFVDVLEKAYRDLKSLWLENEIANANISVIENKLPRVIQMDWYREKYREGSTVNKSEVFRFVEIFNHGT